MILLPTENDLHLSNPLGDDFYLVYIHDVDSREYKVSLINHKTEEAIFVYYGSSFNLALESYSSIPLIVGWILEQQKKRKK